MTTARGLFRPDYSPVESGDGNAMGNYTELHNFDSVGNILEMIHQVATGGWTQHYVPGGQSGPAAEFSTVSASAFLEQSLGPYSANNDHDGHATYRMSPAAHDMGRTRSFAITSPERSRGHAGDDLLFYDGEATRRK